VNSLLKLFLDKLSERIFSLIGSSIGAAATTYHAVQQAEQQSVLEDLARKYEAEGKEEIAAQLRHQASTIATGEPAAAGKLILKKVAETAHLEGPAVSATPSEDPQELLNSRVRRTRRIAAPDLPVTETPES
jgi:hypothetical protein